MIKSMGYDTPSYENSFIGTSIVDISRSSGLLPSNWERDLNLEHRETG